MTQAWPVPPEIQPLVAAIVARAAPEAIWLFGSRARGDHRPDCDWDLAVCVDETVTPDLLDPMTYWMLQNTTGVDATIIPALTTDIVECWGVPNTLGYDLARDGRRLDVDGIPNAGDQDAVMAGLVTAIHADPRHGWREAAATTPHAASIWPAPTA